MQIDEQKLMIKYELHLTDGFQYDFFINLKQYNKIKKMHFCPNAYLKYKK